MIPTDPIERVIILIFKPCQYLFYEYITKEMNFKVPRIPGPINTFLIRCRMNICDIS